MINNNQFRELIIRTTLYDMGYLGTDIENVEELLVFTCAVESLGGTYIKQLNGPAIGIYQMEPATYNDIWQNYIKNKPSLGLILLSNFQATNMPDEFRMIYDLRFATAMCRIHYARNTNETPDRNNIDAVWNYYKAYYNTSKGAADKSESINKYKTFIKSA